MDGGSAGALVASASAAVGALGGGTVWDCGSAVRFGVVAVAVAVSRRLDYGTAAVAGDAADAAFVAGTRPVFGACVGGDCGASARSRVGGPDAFPGAARSVAAERDNCCGRSRAWDWPLPGCSGWALDCGSPWQPRMGRDCTLHSADSASPPVHHVLAAAAAAAAGDDVRHAPGTCPPVFVCREHRTDSGSWWPLGPVTAAGGGSWAAAAPRSDTDRGAAAACTRSTRWRLVAGRIADPPAA